MHETTRTANPSSAVVVLTQNYGEYGALRKWAPGMDVYSGHNALAAFGPPPEAPGPVVVVGYRPAELESWFTECAVAATIDNGVGVANDEQGAPIIVCQGRTGPWSAVWPAIRHIG